MITAMIRTIVFWGLYWGPLILGNYHMNPVMVNCLAKDVPRHHVDRTLGNLALPRKVTDMLEGERF